MDQLREILAPILYILNFPLLHLGDSVLTLLSALKFGVLLVFVGILEVWLRKLVIARAIRRAGMDPSIEYGILQISGYTIYAIGIYISLQLVGINLTSLTVLVGAAGVGLGFGLQNIISNFVSGVIVLAERPIAIGDRIQVGDVSGNVKRISLRSTTVVTNDNISIIIPNSELITKSIINWNRGDPKVRYRLPIAIAYGSDVEKFKKAMVEVSLGCPHVLSKPAPTVLFTGFGENGLNFEIAVWTEEMAAHPLTFESEIYFAVEKKLREIGVSVPFPQREIRVLTGT